MPVLSCYLAAPFFNQEQVAVVEALEACITSAGYQLFSPRQGQQALVMNRMIQAGSTPPTSLRTRVFVENCVALDGADIVVAVVDGRDTGVIFEQGYAYARSIPVITYTQHDYGCNLMLAQSTIGHTKSISQLEHALAICNPRIGLGSSIEDYGAAIAEVQYRYLTAAALVEGPAERAQFGQG